MNPHPTDASGHRDLVGEANKIKMDLTNKDSPALTDSKMTKTNISFTTLAQSAIPNFSASKILANRITVKFVPDFYYILDRCQHLFTLAKMDKVIKRNETLNLYSFTLYVAYSLMYAYLETVQEIDSSNADVTDVLTFLRSAGFNSNKLPSVTSNWINALGKYLDPETKRTFVPILPTQVNQGGYFDNYFFSADTGHLLPNFRAMFTIIGLFADPMSINLPPNNRTRNVKLGSDLPNVPECVGSLESRRYVHRVPGLKRLAVTIQDDQLPLLLTPVLTRLNWPSNLHRYLMLDINVLRYLKESVTEFFLHVDHFVYSNSSPTGTSMVMLPLISNRIRIEIDPAIETAAVAAHGNTPAIPAIRIHSGFDFASRVKSRTDIVNGNVDYVYQTPIVRIIEDAESVKIGNHIHVSPQDVWYTIEHEFQTPVITLPETQAYFHKV